ncbi:polymeric immunoglobulin receptor-like [Leucoraja erinacea]|uniref:polymeric immunoglobulin receptor-like n=1 Tax=Leucoraja erinaceus TaxID=7782 RepID=UPI002453DD6E|nr:polymeric immunoglobulin receptor-like [Leucoraja erinacea]
MDKTMWIPILLISSLPVSGAVWGKAYVRGVVGRAITIDCHYAPEYRSHTKYWCRVQSRQCADVVETNGQRGRSGRMSITDIPARGIFTLTVEDLQIGDTGRYRCGIIAMFHVHLKVSDEPVSVPVLGFLSPANVSCLGDSVSVSCESVSGSLPISYTWYENTPSSVAKISDSNALDLHCQSCKHQHHQYYCTASNKRGSKSSEMVNVSISSSGAPCSFLVEINDTVSAAVWGKAYVRGVVGRAITIDCHYAPECRTHTKYWCRVQSRQCVDVVETNGQRGRSGRASITDNPARGIFTLTVEDLQIGDTGRYRCGIIAMFHVHLKVSDEPVSVPVLGFQSSGNVSCLAGSASVSCESHEGSLPIVYTWFERTSSEDSKVSDTNTLDLHCLSLKPQLHQYYCAASNTQGNILSEVVNVVTSNPDGTCTMVIEVNGKVTSHGKWGAGCSFSCL